MPDISLSCASEDADRFFPSLMFDPKRLAAFRRAIHSHPTMAWAKARCLGDDLEQLALIEVAKILRLYDPSRGTTAEQFIGVALRKRMFSAYTSLVGAYFDDSTPEEEPKQLAGDFEATNDDHDIEEMPAPFIAGGHEEHDEQDQYRGVRAKGGCRDLGSEDLTDRVHPDFWWLYETSRRMATEPSVSLEGTRNSAFLEAQIQLLPVRQWEVLALMLTAKTNREIADWFGVSVQSIGQTRDDALTRLTSAASELETLH